MKITLLEKIMIANILPLEGNIKTLTIVRDLKNKVQLNQKEIVTYGITVNEKGGLNWNKKGVNAQFDIKFTELEFNEIKLSLSKLDKENKLTIDHLSLTEKFKIIGE